jgi:hypothetical protein
VQTLNVLMDGSEQALGQRSSRELLTVVGRRESLRVCVAEFRWDGKIEGYWTVSTRKRKEQGRS